MLKSHRSKWMAIHQTTQLAPTTPISPQTPNPINILNTNTQKIVDQGEVR